MFIYTHPDSNIQSIADLKGRKIVYGGGTGSALLGKQILDVYGITADVTAVRGDTDKARGALEKKEIDAVFSIARLPVPAYSEMVKRQTLKIIPLGFGEDSSAAKALAALSRRRYQDLLSGLSAIRASGGVARTAGSARRREPERRLSNVEDHLLAHG